MSRAASSVLLFNFFLFSARMAALFGQNAGPATNPADDEYVSVLLCICCRCIMCVQFTRHQSCVTRRTYRHRLPLKFPLACGPSNMSRRSGDLYEPIVCFLLLLHEFTSDRSTSDPRASCGVYDEDLVDEHRKGCYDDLPPLPYVPALSPWFCI
jgi:hypothetical protein